MCGGGAGNLVRISMIINTLSKIQSVLPVTLQACFCLFCDLFLELLIYCYWLWQDNALLCGVIFHVLMAYPVL